MSANWYTLVFFFLLSCALQAQTNAAFVASTDAKQVVTNGYLEVSFTLKNAKGTNFQPPNFSDFTVVSGPARSSSTTIINGQMSQELSYVYTLQPKRTGSFTIGRATILVGNQRMTTNPLTVEVVEGTTAPNQSDQEVFIKAEVSTQEAWVGQQIILDYKLYTTIQIENYNIVDESDYQGFFAQDIRRYDSRLVREVVDGVQYVTKVIKRIALFPQRAGQLTIDPLNVQLGALEEGQRRGGFFFNRQLRRIPALTQAVNISVKPLPENAPASFTGAVGKFEISSQINRHEFSTDDAISIKLMVKGNGDAKRIQPPVQQFPEAFEVYDPKTIQENTYESQGELTGEKEIEYLLVPGKPGKFQLQPAFSWFDPDSAAYVTFLSPAFRVDISQGSQRANTPVVAGTETAGPSDIRFIKNETSISTSSHAFLGTPAFWLLTILPFIVVGGAAFWRRANEQKSALDPAILRHRKARKVALKRLESAKEHLQSGKSREFYDAIEHSMDGYVCDKLSIPQSELSREVVRQRLESLQVEEARIERFLQIKQNCEIALYAGMDNSAAMQDTYDQTLALIADIEASMKH